MDRILIFDVHSTIKSDEDLLRECATDSTSASWEEFIHRFHRTIALAIMRTAAQYGTNDRETMDELVQETLPKLCAKDRAMLRTFQSRHENAVPAFLKVVATNLAHDHFSIQASARRGANKISQLEFESEVADADSARALTEEMNRRLLLAELHSKLDESWKQLLGLIGTPGDLSSNIPISDKSDPTDNPEIMSLAELNGSPSCSGGGRISKGTELPTCIPVALEGP